jgi:Domain of Unknown Function (DUF1080)
VAGVRNQLGSVDKLKLPASPWNTLRIEHRGQKIECYLNGKKLLDATDDEAALAGAGRVGLWTKADAQTNFDLFECTDLGVKTKK